MTYRKEPWISESQDYHGTRRVLYKHGDVPKVMGVELSNGSQADLAYVNNRRIKAQNKESSTHE